MSHRMLINKLEPAWAPKKALLEWYNYSKYIASAQLHLIFYTNLGASEDIDTSCGTILREWYVRDIIHGTIASCGTLTFIAVIRRDCYWSDCHWSDTWPPGPRGLPNITTGQCLWFVWLQCILHSISFIHHPYTCTTSVHTNIFIISSGVYDICYISCALLWLMQLYIIDQ